MRHLLSLQPELVGLVKLTELHHYVDHLPDDMQETVRTKIIEAYRKIDDLVRDAKGWGVGDTVQEQFGGRYVVSGYFIPEGHRHANVRLTCLRKDGRPGSKTTWHSLDAHLLKVEPDTANTNDHDATTNAESPEP